MPSPDTLDLLLRQRVQYNLYTENFRTDAISALLRKGVDVTKLEPWRLTQLLTQLWQNPAVEDAYNNGTYSEELGAIDNTLFNPQYTTDPDLLQIGLGLLASQGHALTSAQRNALGAQTQQVPTPFDPAFLGDTTLTFGERWGSETEAGIDYAMPQGTAVYSPFSGTIRTEDSGRSNWGKRVFVVLDNGYTFAIGHMSNFSVTDGERVNPGEILGESGGNPGDPSSGVSTGDHIEVQWIGPDGSFQDPAPIMQSIYSGVTFDALSLGSAAGAGVDKTDAKNRLLGVDPILSAKYPGAVSLWKQYFGTNPTASQILSLVAHGDPKAMEDYIRSLPSQHIPGMNMGQYVDLRDAVDKTMQKLLGHAATDGIVKELFDRGDTAPLEVEHFIGHMAESALSAMNAKTYQTIAAANQPHYQGIYNESGVDPRVIVQQHAQAGGAEATNTQSAQATDNVIALPPHVDPGLTLDEGGNTGLAGQDTPGPMVLDDQSRRHGGVQE